MRTGRLVEPLRVYPATFALVVISIGVFLPVWSECVVEAEAPARLALESVWSLGACSALARRGGLLAAGVWLDGEVWRIGTSALLHGSWLHLALNTWSLGTAMPWAEATWGSARALALFATSAVLAGLASLGWAEAPLVVGSSGGGFGVLAALWVARSWGRGPASEVLAPLSPRGLGVTLGVLMGLGFVVPMVAQAGHLGGTFAGALLGWAWSGGAVRRRLGEGMMVAALVAGSVVTPWSAARWSRYHAFLGQALVERDRVDEGIAALLRGAAGGDPELENEAAYAMALAGVDLERAELLARRASSARPEDSNIADTLGWVLCRQGLVTEGVQALRRADALSEGQDAVIREHIEDCETAAVEDVPRGTSGARSMTSPRRSLRPLGSMGIPVDR